MGKTINKLCEKCYKKCKQTDSVTLLKCPDFEEIPKQLELKFKIKREKGR